MHITTIYYVNSGSGSSVGIATELRVGRSGIECRWGRDFPSVQTGTGAHPASCTVGTGAWGVGLTTPPPTNTEGPRKGYSYTSTHPKGLCDL